MPENFKILDWDTSFFNFKVVEIEKNSLSDKGKCIEIFEELNKRQVKLAYYRSTNALENFNNIFYDIKYIVKRVPLEKKVVTSFPFHEKVSLYENDYPDESLIKLAQLAGDQGRFGRDSKISDALCKEIFKNWMINSVNKKMASHILIYKEDEKIVGVATVDIRNGKGYTPLFAVDRKFEGKGVSFALMRAVETILFQNKCPVAVGGTQDLNRKALMVYKRYGLMPQTPEYIYHLWQK